MPGNTMIARGMRLSTAVGSVSGSTQFAYALKAGLIPTTAHQLYKEDTMTFEELLERIDLVLAKNQEHIDIVAAASIVFSHWSYSMEQTKLDMQLESVADLKTAQKDLLQSLDSTKATAGRAPWI